MISGEPTDLDPISDSDYPRYCCNTFWSWRHGPVNCPRCGKTLNTLASDDQPDNKGVSEQ